MAERAKEKIDKPGKEDIKCQVGAGEFVFQTKRPSRAPPLKGPIHKSRGLYTFSVRRQQ